jgi:DNA-binding CsgD family transcriptional regulator
VRKVGLEYLDGARAILTISDLDVPPPLATGALASLYGLTGREVELCAELLAGRSVTEGAEALAIHVSTARTHLKRILQKTGTSRQGELIALLHRYRAS